MSSSWLYSQFLKKALNFSFIIIIHEQDLFVRVLSRRNLENRSLSSNLKDHIYVYLHSLLFGVFENRLLYKTNFDH